MTEHNWKPGDVATYGINRVMLVDQDGDLFWISAAGTHWRDHDHNPRPLVVIDPEDREQVERLAKAMHESDHIAPWHDLHNETRAQIEDAMQAALREFAAPTPPKPDEPMGLGAVVEDADGRIYTRYETTGEPQPWWQSRHGLEHDVVRRFEWDAIAAVRVLSEGVVA